MTVILIIDDDELLCQMLTRKLDKMGFIPMSAHTIAQGLAMARYKSPEVIFLDVMLPDGSGLDILSRLKELPSKPEVIIFTARGTKDGAEIAIRTGAWDYITKPASLQGMILPLTRALEYRRKQINHMRPMALKRKGIVGKSPGLENCLDQVAAAADSEASVLIQGETGTGKELIATATHLNSRRKKAPFIIVDCGALTKNLAASQLFGHVRGAFTGATQNHTGLLKQAHGGTIFLDEVGELPLDIQKIFLRALQEKRFMPLGASNLMESNFRVLAATNRNLEEMVQNTGFREDLLFRLKAFNILLPPLRERTGDIQELAFHYLKEMCVKRKKSSKGMSTPFIQALNDYGWPGNVRELMNTMERSIAAAGDSPTLYPQHLPVYIRVKIASSSIETQDNGANVNSPQAGHHGIKEQTTPPPTLQTVRDENDRQYLSQVLDYTGGDVKKTCKISGISRSRLYALLKSHNLVRKS